MTTGGLTTAEAAIYDRQLRVWGLETQQKLRSARVLIVGCKGVAAEVAKNIVLAGVGSVTLVDDTPCSRRPNGNFLIPYDADESLSVADASVSTLQEMNPLVLVSAVSEDPSTFINRERVSKYQLVLLVGQSADVVHIADAACKDAAVPFIAASCHGQGGWAFSNAHSHDYIVELSKEQKDGTVLKTVEKRQMQGVSLESALKCCVGKRALKRMSPLLHVLRTIWSFEIAESRRVSPEDVPVLHKSLLELCQAEGLTADATQKFRLSDFVNDQEETPAISAIIGGVIANDIVKVVAAKGEPLINNLFLYSLLDGTGWVEHLVERS